MIYSLVIFAGSTIGRVISIFDKKTKRFFLLRRGQIGKIEEYYKNKTVKRTIWIHAASAGEFEQAKPIIEKFKGINKDYHIIASFFSPSGYDAALKYNDIDFSFNIPLDYKKNIKRLLDCINPEIIIYSKYDVWTNLTKEASKRRIKLFLICGTLPKKSLRYRWPLRFFFRRSYALLDRIYAISRFDARRFQIMTGKGSDRIIVSGDTRFDRIKNVIESKNETKERIIDKKPGTTYLLAGSTYMISEIKLIHSMNRLVHEGKNIRLILVPHEIDKDNIKKLRELVISCRFKPKCFSDSSPPVAINEDEIFIVDAFGVLAHLYSESDIVFVGGSFKGSIHSVLEPAIFGKPVITGPYFGNSYEAIDMKKRGIIKACRKEDDLSNEIDKLICDREYMENIGREIKNYFDYNLGATESIFSDLNKLIDN